jgi:hypothetical protein
MSEAAAVWSGDASARARGGRPCDRDEEVVMVPKIEEARGTVIEGGGTGAG